MPGSFYVSRQSSTNGHRDSNATGTARNDLDGGQKTRQVQSTAFVMPESERPPIIVYPSIGFVSQLVES